MVASSTGWAWLLELILNLIPHKLLQGLFKSTTPTSANWACLPELALNLILHKLQELPDCVRFASVCTTWRIAAKNSGNMQFPVPMLLIRNISNRSKIKIPKTLLYSVQENRTYRVQLPFDDDTFRFRGSSHGWLIKVESVSSIILSSPTTKNPQRATIHLPPITITSISDLCLGQSLGSPKHISMHKVILSADPRATRDYFVVAIYGFGDHLAILRSGDQEWTYLDRSLGLFRDAAWHKNKLYAVTQQGVLMRIDGVTSKNLSPSMLYSTNHRKHFTRFYLVGLSLGELLLVERYIDPSKQDQDGGFTTSGFKVHRLEVSPTKEMEILHPKVWPIHESLLMRVSEKVNWVEVKEIGGDGLFLGENYSVAVAASEMGQCRGNYIYYNDRFQDSDMGIFCLENRKIETLYSPNPPHMFLPSMWFTPVLPDWI